MSMEDDNDDEPLEVGGLTWPEANLPHTSHAWERARLGMPASINAGKPKAFK
jgi:hypothetical protein